MTDTDHKDDKWAVTKARGKKRFILVNGILGWGALLGFATAAGRSLLAGGAFMDSFVRELAIALPIWMAVGALWAVLTWRSMEKAEARQQAEMENENA